MQTFQNGQYAANTFSNRAFFMSQAPIRLPIADRQEQYTVAPTKIIALGLNYRDHIAESHNVKVRGFTNDAPPEPPLFPKTPNVLIGPGDPIVIPAFLYDYHKVAVTIEQIGTLENPVIDETMV